MGLKLTSFKGVQPKVSSELLPDSNAQIAQNCKLYSGDLIPFPQPAAAGTTGRLGDIRTIYPLRNPDTDELVWLSWEDEVNIATPSFGSSVDEQRFYYTGDGVPKVSTYALATAGSLPYPVDYYELGLPLPDDKPVTTAVAYSAKTISSVARAADGTVTFVTSTAHGLHTGVTAATSGFTYLAATYSRTGSTNTITLANHGIASGSTVYLTKTTGTMTDGAYITSNVTTNTFDVIDSVAGATSGNVNIDMSSFHTVGSAVTRLSDMSFTMFLPGFQIATYAVSGATVILAGTDTLRNYLYTWYTPWGEESIGSEPSEDLIVKEGQTVTVSGLPTAKPALPVKNFIQGIRLYRTAGGVEDSDFLLLNNLWFPQRVSSFARAANVVTAITPVPHNLLPDQRLKIAGATNSGFNITDAVVIDTADQYTITYAQAGVDVATTTDATAMLYHDISETPDDTARYWGDTTYDFTDDFDSRNLTDLLVSTEYKAPPEELQGLKVIQNNVVAGFVRNKLYISEPSKPHAWPESFVKNFDVNIVAIEPISGIGTLVLTEGYPWLLTGNDPRVFSTQRIDALYPCVSSRGVVSLSYGVAWPSQEGLAMYGGGGPRMITGAIYEQDTWSVALDPTTISAVYYGDAYFGSHSTASFVFQYDAQSGGNWVNCDTIFTASHNDKLSNRLYFVDSTDGTIIEWDSLEQPTQTFVWKSKTLITKDYDNVGAARVIADYSALAIDDVNWEDDDQNWEDDDTNWDAPLGVNFKLYANKTLVYDEDIITDAVFRLPSGYRSDTVEFEVSGDIRVRAVHLAETPLGLKEV